MPGLTRWFVKASLVYFVAALLVGLVLAAGRLWSLLPAHIEFLSFGWLVQLVMGVAMWILPRFSQEPRRGNLSLAWAAFGLLNLGVLLVSLAPLAVNSTAPLLLGHAAEGGAAVTFVLHAWPRVKALGD